MQDKVNIYVHVSYISHLVVAVHLVEIIFLQRWQVANFNFSDISRCHFKLRLKIGVAILAEPHYLIYIIDKIKLTVVGILCISKQETLFLINNFIAVCILRNSDATLCFGNKKKKSRKDEGKKYTWTVCWYKSIKLYRLAHKILKPSLPSSRGIMKSLMQSVHLSTYTLSNNLYWSTVAIAC